MRVRMIESRDAAPDGMFVVRLEAGHVYDLPEELALSYLARGRAEPAGEERKASGHSDESHEVEPASEEAPKASPRRGRGRRASG